MTRYRQTSDTHLHHRAVDEHLQHIRQSLLQCGWVKVQDFPLIIGHGGTIPTIFSTALPEVGWKPLASHIYSKTFTIQPESPLILSRPHIYKQRSQCARIQSY